MVFVSPIPGATPAAARTEAGQFRDSMHKQADFAEETAIVVGVEEARLPRIASPSTFYSLIYTLRLLTYYNTTT